MNLEELNQAANEEPTESVEPIEEVTPQEPVVEPTELEPTPEPVVEEFAPNLKYKVMDEEFEIPEYLKSVITKENQEEITELFCKAGGLPHVKTKLEKARGDLEESNTRYETLNGEHNTLFTVAQKVDQQVRAGDYHSVHDVVQTLGLREQDLFQYVQKRINYLQGEPEAQRVVDAEQQRFTQTNQLQEQNTRLEATNAQIMQESHDTLLNQSLSSPAHSELIKAYDAKLGEGAFKKVVNAQGLYHSTQLGQELTPAEAVQKSIETLGLVPVQPEPIINQPTPAPQHPIKQTPVVKPVPVIGGSGSGSPVKKHEFTLEGLYKQADEAGV